MMANVVIYATFKMCRFHDGQFIIFMFDHQKYIDLDIYFLNVDPFTPQRSAQIAICVLNFSNV